MLASARGDLQSIRVVHFRAIVVEAPAVGLIEQEHRSQRRNADHVQVGAREERELDVHDGLDARLHGEAVGSRGGLALEQRIDDDRRRLRRRPLDPEMRERRKFLARGLRGIDRQAAGRKAV